MAQVAMKTSKRKLSATTLSRKPWLTLEEAAFFYNMSEGFFRKMLLAGELNASNGAHKIGGTWRIYRAEFESKFIDKVAPSRRVRMRKGSVRRRDD